MSSAHERPVELLRGTLDLIVLRTLETMGWGKTENNREAKYYGITRSGKKALGEEAARWRRLVGLVDKLFVTES